ncbi:MAG: glycosyltransferase [Ruminococcus sp.]|nr:glycosyltransferase [Ruminococcus sp.]
MKQKNTGISIAMIVSSLSINGISEVVMTYGRYLVRDGFKVTIFAGEPVNDKYIEECKNINISIIRLPARKPTTVQYYMKMAKLLNKKDFDIVHVHGNSSIISVDLFIAAIKGVKIRIAHCHNSECTNATVHKLLLPIFNRLYTRGLACSQKAGKWLFGNRPYQVVLNSFDPNRFRYDDAERKKSRNELGLTDEKIIGHIGRINSQKNQEYLVKVLKEICKYRDDVRLLLVGVGPDYDQFRERAAQSEFKDKILFYGETPTPEKLYSVFDVFAFPSKYEGFGMVMTEAQACGLPCVASTAVPEDVVISDQVVFLPIGEEDIKSWAKAILSFFDDEKPDRMGHCNPDKVRKFDIEENIKILEECYAIN